MRLEGFGFRAKAVRCFSPGQLHLHIASYPMVLQGTSTKLTARADVRIQPWARNPNMQMKIEVANREIQGSVTNDVGAGCAGGTGGEEVPKKEARPVGQGPLIRIIVF